MRCNFIGKCKNRNVVVMSILTRNSMIALQSRPKSYIIYFYNIVNLIKLKINLDWKTG